ncbi:MAG: PEP/pyruvate-binding domain-containing protein [Gammaproteobacteria bacterium]
MRARTGYLIGCGAPIEPLNRTDIGGKARNLFRLRRMGIETPDWLVVSSRLFDLLMKEHRTAADKFMAAIDPGDPMSFNRAEKGIAGLIRRIEMPQAFLKELTGELRKNGFYAVRSSVLDEDSASHSFAGQMDSFLNVRADRVADSIKKVWLSAFSARSMLYRKRRGIEMGNISAAVVVQDMVKSAASGVLFTLNPEAGQDDCLISAVYGLGDGVTSDQVCSDTYVVSRVGDVVVKRNTDKDGRIVGAEKGGTKYLELDDRSRGEAVLDDRQIFELRRLGLEIEAEMGGPQDIEWAFDDDRNCWILQARPMTAECAREEPLRPFVWDNSNIIESYPGLTLPLTFSFIRKAYERAFADAAKCLLPLQNFETGEAYPFGRLLGLIDGRVYYNLLNWYGMLSLLPGFGSRKKAWDQMIGITRQVEITSRPITFLNRITAGISIALRLLLVGRTAASFFSRFNPVYRRFALDGLESMDVFRLQEHYLRLEKSFAPFWYLTLFNDMAAMTYYAWLKKICADWLGESDAGAVNGLLRGDGSMESIQPLRCLDELAECIGKNRKCAEMFSRLDDAGVFNRIMSDPELTAVRDNFRDYLRHFGDRGLEDLKLEYGGYRQRPELLVAAIRQAMNKESSRMSGKHRIDDGGEFIQALDDRLRHPLKRIVFDFVLARARLAIKQRENMRFARSRLFGLVRRLFLKMAGVLSEQGVIERPGDIFYLTVDEIFDYLNGTSVNQNLKALVDFRRMQYKGFENCSPPDRMTVFGIPYQGVREEEMSCEYEANTISGIGCCRGIVEGKAVVVLDPKKTPPAAGRILVARSTDPGWAFHIASARGIVIEKGSVLSHTAIISRELGIPTVVGAADATKRIPDGSNVRIDGAAGEVRWR